MGLVPAVVVLTVLALLLLALLMNKALDCKMFPPSAVRAPGRQPPTPSLSATCKPREVHPSVAVPTRYVLEQTTNPFISR